MTQAYADSRYRTTAVVTASPGKLLLMLYDGLVLFLSRARRGLEQGHHEEVHLNLVKGQDIFTELMNTLDMQYGIAADLYRLYDYMRQRLIEANINKEAAIVDEVLTFATDMRATWTEAARLVQQEKRTGVAE